MSNVITLEDIDAAIEKKYAPLVLRFGDDEFVLQSLLRVDKKVREAVIDKLKELDGKIETDDEGKPIEVDDDLDEDKTIATVKFVLRSVTKDGKGAHMVKYLGNDLLKHMTLLSMWTEATKPGEATDSPA
jgi:hypothetical protein